MLLLMMMMMMTMMMMIRVKHCRDTSHSDNDKHFGMLVLMMAIQRTESTHAIVQSAPSLATFRQKLKTHLFQQSYPDVFL